MTHLDAPELGPSAALRFSALDSGTQRLRKKNESLAHVACTT